MKILVTGASGLLGPYLQEAFHGHGVVATRRAECDLSNRKQVKELISEVNPEIIIHAAGMTNVDHCEVEPYKALDDNRQSTHHLVEQMSPYAKMVYLSTDMVYPDIRGPHREADVAPINMYGRSKLAGEKAAAINAHALIVRTNFFGQSHTAGKVSFSDWVVQSLTDGSTPIFFNDVLWNPVHMKTLCTLLCELVGANVVGTYNLGATTHMSKAAFAAAVAEQKGLLDRFNRAAVGPAHFHTARPKDLCMDVTKIEALGWRMPTLEEEIRKL